MSSFNTNNTNNKHKNEKYMISSFRRRRRSSSSDGGSTTSGRCTTNVDPYFELFEDDDGDDDDGDDGDDIQQQLEEQKMDVNQKTRDGIDDLNFNDDLDDLSVSGNESSKYNTHELHEGSAGKRNIHFNKESSTLNVNGKSIQRIDHGEDGVSDVNGVNYNKEDFTNFEEELGLNEAMLESLNEKLNALDQDIASERNLITNYDSTIDALTKEQIQLRNTREINMNLMKSVTLTMKKCLQRLRKKLDEKSADIATITEVESSGSDHLHHDDDHDDVCIDESENDCIPNTDDDVTQNRKQSMDKKDTVNPQESIYIFKNSIQVQPIHHDKDYMKKMWSQNYPNYRIFQHFKLLKDPMVFPLHPPISCPKKLQRMVEIIQVESTLRRQEIIAKGDISSLKEDYKNEIRGTCLDIYSSLQYDPFFLNILPTIWKSNAYDSEDSNNDENDDAGNIEIKQERLNSNEQKDKVYPIAEKSEYTTSSKDSKPFIDPNTILCRYDLIGICNDPACPYQHLNDTSRAKRRRVVKKKGMNKISLSIKESTPPSRSVDDYIVHLPPLTLPPLPFSDRPKQNLERKINNENQNNSLEDIESDEVIDHANNQIQESLDKTPAHIQKKCTESNDTTDTSSKINGTDDVIISQSISTHVDHSQNLPLQSNKDDEIEINSKKRKALDLDKSGQSDNSDDDDDFIQLPPAPHDNAAESSEDDNQTCTSEEWDEGIHHMEIPTNEFENENVSEPIDIYDVLKTFNFKVTAKSSTTESNIDIVYMGCSFGLDVDERFSTSQRNIIRDIINSLILISDIIDATRLCIYAGRIDICRALNQIGKDFFDRQRCTYKDFSDTASNFLRFHSILQDIEAFVDGSICGRGSRSLTNNFHVQLGLSIIAYFIRCYRQATLEQDDYAINDLDEKRLWQKYKRFAAIALGKFIPKVNAVQDNTELERNPFPYHLIPKKKNCVNFVTDESTPKNRVGRVIECYLAGQNIAHNIANKVFCLDEFNDPQVILDKFLLPLSSLVQNHVLSNKSSVAEDAIDTTLKGEPTRSTSIGLPTQLCIFAIFGPSVITCFSAIFYYIKKSEDNGGSTTNGMDSMSRNQGILIEAKKIIMMLIELFDQSAISGENFEGRLLLTPYFMLMANLLTTSESYSKTQILLENAIYSGDNTSRSWSIYSQGLWSMLLQLHACFQSHEGCTSKSVGCTINNSFIHQPLRYGLNVLGLSLKGDSSLVQSATFYRSKRIKNITQDQLERRAIFYAREACQSLTQEFLLDNSHNEALSLKILPSFFDKRQKLFPLSILLSAKSIQNLCVNNFDLKQLPYSFGTYLSKLKTLDLARNHLQSLPGTLDQLEELEEIDISHNYFRTIPQVLRLLPKLNTISIAHNNIEDMTPLLNCKELMSIDIRSNKIKNIPTEMALKLKKLSKLHIDNIHIQDQVEKESDKDEIKTSEYENSVEEPISRYPQEKLASQEQSFSQFSSFHFTPCSTYVNNDPTPFSINIPPREDTRLISHGPKLLDNTSLFDNQSWKKSLKVSGPSTIGGIKGDKGSRCSDDSFLFRRQSSGEVQTIQQMQPRSKPTVDLLPIGMMRVKNESWKKSLEVAETFSIGEIEENKGTFSENDKIFNHRQSDDVDQNMHQTKHSRPNPTTTLPIGMMRLNQQIKSMIGKKNQSPRKFQSAQKKR